jgi:hypothetical protein
MSRFNGTVVAETLAADHPNSERSIAAIKTNARCDEWAAPIVGPRANIRRVMNARAAHRLQSRRGRGVTITPF